MANREFDFVDDSMSDDELVEHLKQLEASNNFVKLIARRRLTACPLTGSICNCGAQHSHHA
jgi:hypothetical protein